nr:hypothetical protein [Tanacetum cinerariifolium]
MAAFNVFETQFQMFITSWVYLNDEYVAMTCSYFIQYTQQAILEFHDTLIQHLEFVKKSIYERAQLEREYDSWSNERQMQTTKEKVDTSKALDASSVDTESTQLEREYDSWSNERQMQTTKEKVDTSKALDASSVDTESSKTESKEQDTSSRSGNDTHDDDVDRRPIYDKEPMAKVQTTTEINVFAIGQQHTEQPEFNNEGEVEC